MKTFPIVRCVGLAIATMVCVGIFPQEVSAQTVAQKQAAKEHFEQARRLYDVGRYPAAIEEYQKAYLNVEDPVFLFNIAQAYRLNDQPEEAIRFYKNYLRRAPEAVNRSEVERHITQLQKELQKRERATQPPAEPTRSEASKPPARVSPPLTQPPARSVQDVTDAPEAASDSGKWRTTGIILAGVGGGLIVTSVLSGAMANKAARDVEKGPVFDPDIENRGRAFNGVAIVSGILGLVAGVAGGYLIFTSGDEGPTNAGVASPKVASPRVALAPVVGNAYTGAQASLRF